MMDKVYFDGLYEKLCVKMKAVCERTGDKIPYIARDGRYEDMATDHDEGIFWWTNGFWPGILWQMYHATKDEAYRTAAVGVEKRFDAAFEGFLGLHHDVGFQWLHTAVANYRLTQDKDAYRRSMHAANILTGRFNPDAKYIRAWNFEGSTGYTIVDTMMNLPLLHWVYRETGDPRFMQIAKYHADTCMRVTVRPDGSCNHVVDLDPDNGEVVKVADGQGYSPESSWTRGNSWALYGFGLSYRHTGEQRYLDTAKRIAHYFISNLAINEWLPLVDFRAPEEPVYYDTTAGMIASCGMLEIAGHVPELEKRLYRECAINTITACEKKFADWDPGTDGVMGGGAAAYHDSWGGKNKDVPIIYGDYFFTEAIMRLNKKDFLIW